jgi:hypothetical protein
MDNIAKCLKRRIYCNTIFNLDGGNADALQGHVLISDITILADITVSPPLLFLSQYYAWVT